MKVLIALSVLAAVAYAQYYDSKYDDFDANELVDNERLLTAYGNCFASKGPCTPEGENFKKVIPDAIRSKCGKCSPKQKVLIRTVIKGFQSKTPKLWEEIVDHYDPKHEYKTVFLEFLNASD